jgi:sporulation protein YlmC with PRC-barrel domain
MLEEITSLHDLQVYTNYGAFIGRVTDLILDISKKHVDGIYIAETNEALVENSHSINVPYRWVQSVGDIIILKHFPDRIDLTEDERKKMDALREFQYSEYE